ncbi:MAG: metallophosphoesterase family protein [Acidobacteriota bacterium]|nr:metallophosphoesterase family protein [Acidobacteriota bacterium]
MRTLAISDLHIGAGRGRAALDDAAVREALASALAGVDRLVLLGDIIELRQGSLQDALAAASRVLPQLVGGLGSGREVILLVGNHDHQLQLHPEALAQVVAMLASAGAQVRVEYPGVWLREDVYAQHGHYLDRHTTTPAFERVAAGAMARFLKLPFSEMSGVDDYERLLAPVYAWMFAISQTSEREIDAADGGGSARALKLIREARGLRGLAVQGGLRSLLGAANLARLGPFSPDLSPAMLRRSSLLAFGEVLSVLGLSPSYALFGHTHRAGPLPGDAQTEWVTPAGVRMLNSGCWVHESTAFMSEEPRDNPYRPGFAIELDDDGPPRLVNLLDR